MPDGGRSFYTDAREGSAWERHILEDVIGFVDHFFPTIPERRGRAIGGLSMGGYGAMKLALKRPDLFGSASAHSGCHRIVRDVAAGLAPAEHADLLPELRRIYGAAPSPDTDPFALAARIDRAIAPALRFDCGLEDFLLDHSRDFHAHLARLGLPHEYREHPGGHTWDYWDAHVPEALAFHAARIYSV